MPFPPINLHQRITSPGRDLFRRKKPNVVPPQTAAPPGDEKRSDKEKVLSITRSWPSANLRNLGRKSSSSQQPQQQQQNTTRSPPRKLVVSQEKDRGKCSWLPVSKSQDSCGVVTRSSSSTESSTTPRGRDLGPADAAAASASGEKEIRFSLSLTPEAILVIQKRNLEKQMIEATKQQQQQKCCVSADLRHRRIFPSSTKKAQSGGKCNPPVLRVEDAAEQLDITAIVKISLLNDRYKYDDVEYEEEEDGDGDVDETVVRKCKEWLKGVESAAGFGKVDKLSTLPHLKGC
ncbi:hypothetical protein NHX12_022432 [Muraenolepis orangiensis]|uniref:Proline-rich protein 18 n=1 Tax=Muraenolepis orangiensis TaxID=630683 RepID=A0A9Q0ERK8_9TELE|nr:hypothetical protein NHX12_022432 [Muraenolepis orangiensis]